MAVTPPAVLVLVCGLPAAGKTTLVKKLAESGSTAAMLYERISFDDLYAQMTESSCFDPDKWKLSQQEMVARVSTRIGQQNTGRQSEAKQQLVLLVDDNFQYRSQRKRFFHLAIDLECAFGILYVNVPASICRERNTLRSEDGGRIPDKVFQTMKAVFEAPNCHGDPWEHNTMALTNVAGGTDHDAVMIALIEQAERDLRQRRLERTRNEAHEAQRRRDQSKTQKDIAHLVDLQLRRWMSAQLRSENNVPANLTKAQYASQLNQRRKNYLASIKNIRVNDKDTAENVVNVLTRRFTEQE